MIEKTEINGSYGQLYETKKCSSITFKWKLEKAVKGL